MQDYLFKLINEEAVDRFVDLLKEEELWGSTDRKNNNVKVVSIFDETASYLYDWLEERNLLRKDQA